MTNNRIQRYTVSGDIAYPIHEDPEGDYVTYDDHVAAIEADCKRRGEPVAWLRKNGFRFNAEIEPQDDSELPLYTTPQPAEPVKKKPYAQGTALGEFGIIPMCDQVNDEPVKVPSDAISVVGVPEFDALMDHIYENGTASEGVLPLANAFARALLARYGKGTP